MSETTDFMNEIEVTDAPESIAYKLVEPPFNSLQGEGPFAGYLCNFIRLSGCNLRCSFCDTKYSYDEGVMWSTRNIIKQVDSFKRTYGVSLTEITGGEPMLNDLTPLITELISKKLTPVLIETNGSIALHDKGDIYNFNHVRIIMDWKCKSSGMTDKMDYKNLDFLGEKDALKFVVKTQEDLIQVKEIIDLTPNLRAQLFISPVFGEIDMKMVVEFMKRNKMNNVKFFPQIHKIIWEPTARGV